MLGLFRGSKVDNYFKVSQRGSNLTTEIRAGMTTFLMAQSILHEPEHSEHYGAEGRRPGLCDSWVKLHCDLDHGAVGELAFRLWPMSAVTIEVVILMSLCELRRYVLQVFPTVYAENDDGCRFAPGLQSV